MFSNVRATYGLCFNVWWLWWCLVQLLAFHSKLCTISLLFVYPSSNVMYTLVFHRKHWKSATTVYPNLTVPSLAKERSLFFMRGNVFSNVLECLIFYINITCFHSLVLHTGWFLHVTSEFRSRQLGAALPGPGWAGTAEGITVHSCRDPSFSRFPSGRYDLFFLCNFIHLVCVHWSSFLELSFRKPISDQAGIIHTITEGLSLTHTLDNINYGPLGPFAPCLDWHSPDLCCTENQQGLHFNEWQPQKMCAKD